MATLIILLIVSVIALMAALYFLVKTSNKLKAANRAEEDYRARLTSAGIKLSELCERIEDLESVIKSQKEEIERLTNELNRRTHPPEGVTDVQSDSKPTNKTSKKK